MKIPPPSRRQDGIAVIVVISFLAILLIFVSGNLRTLHLLHTDLKNIERQQTNRLAIAGITTNSPGFNPAAAAPGKPKPNP